MSPFLVCSPSLIISGLAPMESRLDILKRGWWGKQGGVKDRKEFHQAGKLKKAFGLSSPRRPRSYTLCLFLLNFPIPFFYFPLSFSLPPHFFVEQMDVGVEDTPSLWCMLTTGILWSMSYLTKHGVAGSNPVTRILVWWNVFLEFLFLWLLNLNDPNTRPAEYFLLLIFFYCGGKLAD